MRRKFIGMVAVFSACSVLLRAVAGAGADVPQQKPTEIPQWASILPADAIFVAAVEDVERFTEVLFPSEPSKEGLPSIEAIVALLFELDPKSQIEFQTGAKLIKTFLGAFRGSLAVGASGVGESPTVFLVGELKPEVEDFEQFLSRSVLPGLVLSGIDPVVGKEKGVSFLRMKDSKLYFTTWGSRVAASTNLGVLLRMKEGNLPAESVLAGQASFRKAVAAVPAQGVFVFVDAKKVTSLMFSKPSSGAAEGLSNLGLDRLESVGFSANIDGPSVKLNFGLVNAGEWVGLPAIIFRPNTGSHAANLVPADYSLFLRLSVAGAPDAYHEWQATVKRMVDEVSWKEYQDDVAKLSKERGFTAESVLANLGDEIAVAIKIPELLGIPPVLVFVGVKDEAKALDLVRSILTQAGIEVSVVSVPNGTAICTTTLMPGVVISYTAKGGYLIFGLSPSSLMSALEAAGSGKSLADDPRFVSAMTASREKNLLFCYVDMQRVARFAASAIPPLVYWRLTPPPGDPNVAKGALPSHIAEIVQMLNREAEQMGSAVFCATGEKDCLLLEVTFPAKIIRLASAMAAEPIALARKQALRTACMHNLAQIATACIMYANDHKGMFPEKLSQLVEYVGSLNAFSCPESGTVISRPEDIDSKSSYKLIGGFNLNELKNTSEKLILYEELKNHGNGAVMAFADAHVRWATPEAYREILKEAGL